MPEIDRGKLTALLAEEQATYATNHPRSKALFDQANHLFGRVPMTWMNMWAGGFPLYLDSATANRVRDVDGHEYIDFALGDTGANGETSHAGMTCTRFRSTDEAGSSPRKKFRSAAMVSAAADVGASTSSGRGRARYSAAT